MDDAYFTIRQESKTEIKVKGSRFIGETLVVSDVEEAMTRLATVQKREYSATHHCYAYIVGLPGDQLFKYSDDGEPNSTAGKPIYDVVAATDVTDILCVVTRYFGGTKLGTGGLVRAYSDAAKAVMELSGVREHFLVTRFQFTIDFPLYDRWMKTIGRLGAVVTDTQFSDKVSMQIQIRNSRTEQLVSAFTELSSGKGQFEKLSTD